jgi:hypothetical protein
MRVGCVFKGTHEQQQISEFPAIRLWGHRYDTMDQFNHVQRILPDERRILIPFENPPGYLAEP